MTGESRERNESRRSGGMARQIMPRSKNNFGEGRIEQEKEEPGRPASASEHTYKSWNFGRPP